MTPMRIAYLDCASGISGDMLLGALIDAGVGLDAMRRAIDSLELPGCRLTVDEVRRGGFRAARATVHVEAEQTARHLADILRILGRANLTDTQKKHAETVFHRLAEAEAAVHGIDVEQVHFHELGAVDTIVDVVGAVVGFDLLGVERIVASPIPTGSGTVRISHGTVSVPAPATAELLRGVPLAESSVKAELTTPTGAAVVTTLAHAFGPMPAMTLETIGRGAGGRDLAEQPNLLRLLVGKTPHATGAAAWPIEADEVWLLETNLDNATGEEIGYCIDRLWHAGALDVWTTSIQMKKNRPGVMLSVLGRLADAAALEAILFRETPTLGVRRRAVGRHVLQRKACEVVTPWGAVAGKLRRLPDGTEQFSPEYESCRATAERAGVALHEVHEAARRAFDIGKGTADERK